MFTQRHGARLNPQGGSMLWQWLVLTACACGMGTSLAQTNGTAVGTVVENYCTSRSNLSACSALGIASTTELSQFAPDKLVMQSRTALGTTRQQLSLVDRRLDELRHAKFGGAKLGATGPQSFLARTGGSHLAPQRTASLLSRGPVLLASTNTSWSDILLAQDSVPATTEATPSSGIDDGLPSSDSGLYFRGEWGRGDVDATILDPGFRTRSVGLTVGGDHKVSANSVVGAAIGYVNSRSTLDNSDGTLSGNVKTRGASLSLYGAYYPTDTSYVDTTVVYGRNRYESIRNIANPAVTDSALGDTDGEQYGLSFGAGYSFLSSSYNFGPYARVSWSRAEVDAFNERPNDSGSNLAVQAQSAESLVSVVGAQISYAISKNWGVLVPNARVEWEHQYKDDRTRNIRAKFVEDTSSGAMDIETTRPDRNYFNLGLGLASHFGVGRSAFLYYQTVLGKSGANDHAITAELRLEF